MKDASVEAKKILAKMLGKYWYLQCILENEKLGLLTGAEEEALTAWKRIES